MGGMSETTTRPSDGLRQAVERCGYYPEVVVESIDLALAGEQVLSYLVHHEATFDRDELRRHGRRGPMGKGPHGPRGDDDDDRE